MSNITISKCILRINLSKITYQRDMDILLRSEYQQGKSNLQDTQIHYNRSLRPASNCSKNLPGTGCNQAVRTGLGTGPKDICRRTPNPRDTRNRAGTDWQKSRSIPPGNSDRTHKLRPVFSDRFSCTPGLAGTADSPPPLCIRCRFRTCLGGRRPEVLYLPRSNFPWGTGIPLSRRRTVGPLSRSKSKRIPESICE